MVVSIPLVIILLVIPILHLMLLKRNIDGGLYVRKNLRGRRSRLALVLNGEIVLG